MTSRTWLVTGCSRGLGHALATAILASGDRLVATARDPATLADMTNTGGDRIHVLPLNVTEGPSQVCCSE
jgi:NAD(P)-dependent dehydrogenase (short-subunit alcohol dehydrogenase family)